MNYNGSSFKNILSNGVEKLEELLTNPGETVEKAINSLPDPGTSGRYFI